MHVAACTLLTVFWQALFYIDSIWFRSTSQPSARSCDETSTWKHSVFFWLQRDALQGLTEASLTNESKKHSLRFRLDFPTCTGVAKCFLRPPVGASFAFLRCNPASQCFFLGWWLLLRDEQLSHSRCMLCATNCDFI